MPSVQEPSQSAGQTRLVNSGKLLVEERISHAPRQSPEHAAALNSGITFPSGHPAPWQNGMPHPMQRAACS